MVYMHYNEKMEATNKKLDSELAIIGEITPSCLLTRVRRVSRVVTSIFDQELRRFNVNASQFSMLVLIARLGSASRAEISRANHQERSTSTRNLNILLSEGWAEEVEHQKNGRRIPITLSQAGRDLLTAAMPAWRSAQAETRRLLGEEGADAMVMLADNLPVEDARG